MNPEKVIVKILLAQRDYGVAIIGRKVRRGKKLSAKPTVGCNPL
jgi:hypothetical protein